MNSNKELFEKNKMLLIDALRALGERFRPLADSVNKDRVSKNQATKRGAKHKIGSTFRSKRVNTMTPAQYRHAHLGVVVIEPNYKKQHPKPRGRNVI